jgi:DNA mismatch endonuclease (patch repair protein)
LHFRKDSPVKSDWRTDSRTSERMKRVRRSATAPELRVAKALRLNGLRFRTNVKSVGGTPDFCNKSRRWVIFVHGCFWHGHDSCTRATIPLRNRREWVKKIKGNQSRDKRVLRALRAQGFAVIIVWECETLTPARLGTRLRRFLETQK